jgi:hypothetical protein
MKRITVLLLAISLGAQSMFGGKPQVVLGPGQSSANFRVPYHQTWNRTLSKDTAYVLTGWYFVDSTHTLTIPAGTLIYGDKPSAGTLIVKRGAQINAAGTAVDPIIFTSMQAAGSRAPGDWGGVIILGNAPINQFEPQIEGGFGTIANSSTAYGGNNPTDNSGVFAYVRIEYAGIAFSQDNEINGLTLGGVGSGTTMHHVQISYANDDDMEFFGGTVSAKYILTMGNIDDNFDTDFGFAGRLQFIAAFRDSTVFDASASGQSNGNESDNNANTTAYPYYPPLFPSGPVTHYTVSNMTLVGPFQDSTSSISGKWGHLQLLRRNTAPRTYNSIIEGWPLGMNIRDSLTQVNALNDSLRVRCTSIASKSPAVRATGNSPAMSNAPGFDPVAWFNTAAWKNRGCGATGGGRLPAAIGLINPAQSKMSLGTWDPRPAVNSEADTAGTSFDGLDSWFDNVSYRGAFTPGLPMSQQWTAGWTQLNPQGYDPEITAGVEESSMNLPARFELAQNYPNPFNPSTTINFSIPRAGQVQLRVYSALGQEVATLVDGMVTAGSHSIQFNARGLASGAYIYRLTSGSLLETKIMLLIK